MNAFDLIRRFEGYRDNPYWDVNAYRVGYGSDTITMPDGSVVSVKPGMTVDRAAAERDLARRVETEFMPIAMNAVGPQAWGALGEPQKAVLASIAYNYGRMPQNVAMAIKNGDLSGAASAIEALSSHNGGVNAKRRAEEARIFAGGAFQGGVAPAEGPQAYAQNPQQPPSNALAPPQMAALDPAAFMRSRNALAYAPIEYTRRNALGQL